MEQPVLQVENVSLQYTTQNLSTVVCYKLNFDLHKNERITIVGKSGCGKTTLLSAIAGYLKPSEGKILINSKPVEKPGVDRMVVFQEHALFPWKKVLENVTFPLIHSRKLPKQKAEARAMKYLNIVGLEDQVRKYPHQLSGGQKQRVSIARAFAMEPEVLLMDEPFSALDHLTKSRLQNELLELCEKTKATVLFITHDINEALVIGHRILVLSSHPGQIIAVLNSVKNEEGAEKFMAMKEKIEKLLGVSSEDVYEEEG